jgi:hypothetical protein
MKTLNVFVVAVVIALAATGAEAAKKKSKKAASASAEEKPAEAVKEEPAAAAAPAGPATDVPDADKHCKAELAAHCKDVKPGDNRVATCLRAHKDALSDPCKKAYYGFLKARFETACGPDHKKHCASAQGNPMICLKEHGDSLSEKCKEVIGLKPAAAAAPAAPAPK